MFRQILKQLWYYRRGNAWLFIEMTLIAAASWFLVNAVWPNAYRKSLPDGYDARGVYAVSINRLYDGQTGFRPEMDSRKQRSADFHRIGQALRDMPEIEYAAAVGSTMPGLSLSNYNHGLELDTVTGEYLPYAYHLREAGGEDLKMMDYRQIWPEGAPIEDVPGTVIITEDVAETLFPGENPVGRRLGRYSDQSQYGWTIAGVIAPVKVEKDKEYRPMIFFTTPDIVREEDNMDAFWCFRLAPGVDEEEFIQKAKMTWREDLVFGNYRTGSVFSMEKRQKDTMADTFIWQALLVFVLLCVLIGVASFAWLRTRERRGEIGVRRAMGGSWGALVIQQLSEVWMLWLAAMLLGLVIVLNILIIGKVNFCASALYDGYLLDLTRERLSVLFDPVRHFLAVSGIAAAVMLAVVTLSTIVPVAGALKESPADVLKDE